MTVQTPQTDELAQGSEFTTPVEDNGDEEESTLSYNLDRFAQLKKMGVDGLVKEGARLCELYGRATPHLRALAEVVVALRFKHKAPVGVKDDGTQKRGFLMTRGQVPDWGGQSDGYQRAIKRIYEDAGVGNKASDIRNALGYHVQNLVKEVAPDAQLIKLGLKTEKRGAGGAAGKNEGTAGKTTAVSSQTASTVASKTGTKINPLEYLNDAMELLNGALRNVSAGQEATKKGITDDDLRIKIIHICQNIIKTSAEVNEMATAMSARHQGRASELKKPEAKKPAAEPKKEALHSVADAS